MSKPTAIATGPLTEVDGRGAPTPQIIGYARRMLRRRYGARVADVDDLIGQALLDFVAVTRSGRPGGDGLFLVIAHRRACDFLRKRKVELPLEAAARVAYAFDDSRLDGRVFLQHLGQAILGAGRLDKGRLLGISSQILAGASFPEACRASGVPRGSQERYRRALGRLLSVARAWRPVGSKPLSPVA